MVMTAVVVRARRAMAMVMTAVVMAVLEILKLPPLILKFKLLL